MKVANTAGCRGVTESRPASSSVVMGRPVLWVEAFFGFYPVVQHAVTIKEQQVSINDVMGKD
ncbi:hypothetical protein ACWD6N_32665, partial [Micromonospora sp. NPDC005163]